MFASTIVSSHPCRLRVRVPLLVSLSVSPHDASSSSLSSDVLEAYGGDGITMSGEERLEKMQAACRTLIQVCVWHPLVPLPASCPQLVLCS